MKKERKTKLGPIFGFVKKINEPNGTSLTDLRNKSILAHGFEGISKDYINELYGSDKLIDDLKRFIDTFEFDR